MKRRGQGEGSIYQRKDNGLWVGTVNLGWHAGKRVRRAYYGRSRREVQEKLQRALREVQDGVQPGTRRDTVGGYLASWLEAVEPSVRHSTFRRYRQIVTHQLTPQIGRTPLSQLTPADVEAMLRRLAADGLSSRSVHHVRAVLRTALARAARHGLVARNAAALAEPPHVERREVRALDPAEVRRFLSALEGHPLRCLFTVALATGLRKGELLGLRWSDIDLAAGTLTVRRSLQRIEGKFRVVEPKTAKSRRTVPLPGVAVTALAEHRQAQASAPVVGAYVFTTADGQPFHGTTVWRALQSVLEAAGLPSMPFHALRHTAASLLLAEGVHPRVVMELLGHSTIALTMNTYSHVIPALEREAADRMERMLTS